MTSALAAGALPGANLSTAVKGGELREDRDRLLVADFKRGDRRAFEGLVRRYQRPIYYLALRYLGNDADASDLTQKTFLRAYQALDRFREDASFRTWLYRIAINLALNHKRDQRLLPIGIGDSALVEEAVGAGRMIRGEERARLRAAIAELPPKQRMVLELRIYDELPFREVAALAECTENAAKVSFHHAVKRLRAVLAGAEGRGGKAAGGGS